MIPAVLLGLVAAITVAALFLSRPAKPAYYRRRTADFTWDMVQTLVTMAEGSVMMVEHEGSHRFLQFRKAADTGEKDQAIVLGFPRAEWSAAYFDVVAQSVGGAGFAYHLATREAQSDEQVGMLFLEVELRGVAARVAERARELVYAILPAIELPQDALFTFHVEGTPDPAIWRRVNEDLLEHLGERGRLGLTRRVAKKQLDKLRSD